jgi:chemotaxis protein methyltransferase CheR
MPAEPERGNGADDSTKSWQGGLPLAHGELKANDAQELATLKVVIQRTIGLNCDAYKEPCLRRRLAVRMRARGIHQYSVYAALLDEDHSERARLLDAITINVSKFFRNHEVWDLFEKKVVPELFAMRGPKVRIWSAGCAGGEEPYTIAMVLRRYAEAHGEEASLRKFDILATDVDPGILESAKKAEYSDFAFTEIRPEAREHFFDGSRVKPEIRKMVRFGQLDLMMDPFPRQMHLILCRNVIIYFERSVQERIFRNFHDSLTPGGYLILGKVETVFGGAAALYRAISTRDRLFCKV